MVAYKTAGTVVTGTSGTLSVPHPAGLELNDVEFMVVANKGTGAPTAPSGWSATTTGSYTGGTIGADTGPVYITVFYRQATGGETGNVAVTLHASSTAAWAQMVVLRMDTGNQMLTQIGGTDNAANTSFTVTASVGFSGANPRGAYLLAAGAMTSTAPTLGDPTMTMAAQTLGTPEIISKTYNTSATNHIAGAVAGATVNATTQPNASTNVAWPLTGTITSAYGAMVFVLIQERGTGYAGAATAAKVGEWGFDEASGNALDTSGRNNPLKNIDSTAAREAARIAGSGGKAANGLWQTDYASTPLIASGSQNISMSCWFKYTGSTGDKGVVTILNSTSDYGGIFLQGDKPCFWVQTADGFFQVATNYALTSGQWYHLAGVWSMTKLRFYINGVLQSESSSPTGSWNANLTQIIVQANSPAVQVGAVDDVRVYNYGISREQVITDLCTHAGYATRLAADPARFPVSIPSGKQYYIDGSGDPYFMRMNAAWQLFLTAKDTDHNGYLANRKDMGFNSAYVTTVRDDQNHWSGESAFLDAALTPNPRFWAHFDRLLDKAAAHGITLLHNVVCTWDPAGSTVARFVAATDAQCYAFGQWLASRYGSRPNHWLLFGGDWALPHSATLVSRVKNIIDGFRAAGGTHPVIFHETEESIGTADAALAPYATVAMPYTYTPTYFRTRIGFATGKPSAMFEANYEFENNNYTSYPTTDETLRRQLLWSMITGQMGVSYGAGLLYNFTSSDWTQRMETEAQWQYRRLFQTIKDYRWWELAPDTNNSFITAGRGTERTSWVAEDVLQNDFATAAIHPSGTHALAYVPTRRDVTLNGLETGANKSIKVIDPSTGGVLATYTAGYGVNTTIPLSNTTTFPNHADGTADFLIAVTADASPTGNQRKAVIDSALMDVIRRIVQGSSAVVVTN